MDIKGMRGLKANARIAAAARLHFWTGIHAVDGLSQNAGTGGFSYSPRPAKQKGMGYFIVRQGIPERSCNVQLPHHIVKRKGPVFSR
jgi:hypothetical protein